MFIRCLVLRKRGSLNLRSNRVSKSYEILYYSKVLPVGIVVFSQGGSLRRSASPFSLFSLPSYSFQSLGRSSETKSAKPGPSRSFSRIASSLLVCLHL